MICIPECWPGFLCYSRSIGCGSQARRQQVRLAKQTPIWSNLQVLHDYDDDDNDDDEEEEEEEEEEGDDNEDEDEDYAAY
ncbi:unnamed protein product [Schistocephalus solidus]|uniref:Uncharacterized protein n=1 Tax=Schistocephalus solidus TaxID=70667 RepID=A0A183SHU8_SCHSO|nr:unnamed protein product [Schistocephalus solidus]